MEPQTARTQSFSLPPAVRHLRLGVRRPHRCSAPALSALWESERKIQVRTHLVSCPLNSYAFAGGDSGGFQSASEAAVSFAIRPDRATQKSAKTHLARTVGMKMARRRRCSSVTDPGYALSSRLGVGHFGRHKCIGI